MIWRAAFCIEMLLLAVALASAATKQGEVLTIRIMSATTESIPLSTDDNGVPKNCGIMDYDAYCHHSRNAIVHHTILVQDSDGKSFTVSCTVDSIWSKCTDLPVGMVFIAERTKHGITVHYPNAKGKEVKQAYALATAGGKSPVASVPQQSASVAFSDDDAQAGSVAATETSRATVKCKFNSTPAGADITLDGKYVGNAPSSIAVESGTHLVEMTMPGFSTWKRQLTVYAGSDVDVNATLQKR
jgi:hypothetical protein